MVKVRHALSASSHGSNPWTDCPPIPCQWTIELHLSDRVAGELPSYKAQFGTDCQMPMQHEHGATAAMSSVWRPCPSAPPLPTTARLCGRDCFGRFVQPGDLQHRIATSCPRDECGRKENRSLLARSALDVLDRVASPRRPCLSISQNWRVRSPRLNANGSYYRHRAFTPQMQFPLKELCGRVPIG